MDENDIEDTFHDVCEEFSSKVLAEHPSSKLALPNRVFELEEEARSFDKLVFVIKGS